MSVIQISVIIPTHNQPAKLQETLAGLRQQTMPPANYEVIVVDDGSAPPVVLPEKLDGLRCVLLRLEGVERSAARNRGAMLAQGELLIFLDDDMRVSSDFLSAHWRAHRQWPEALLVGSVRLPDEALKHPFGRFRQRLERQGAPRQRGLTAQANFCTAANMAISRSRFEALGGFNPALHSSEDQDFALRHTAGGGQIVYVPEADAVHRDDALDIRRYCRRVEWGMQEMLPFCHRYPNWPDNVQRERVNGPVRWGREPVWHSARKLIKAMLSRWPMIEGLFAVTWLLERSRPESHFLDRMYRVLLGVHLFRGYRKGLKRYGVGPAPPPRFAQTVE
ncbi:MAG: glycosyltransferase family A protein [Acidobacteriota bacterium]|nr:glycosyltransferase family 2 protein [Blastocatellia bacterium]MDW8240516.1 glycosyltransferase family A protein [Acidobacteriota bacterium]